MKHKILSLVLLGLMCSIGNVWSQTTYSLIDRSGATLAINSTDFKGAVASTYLKTSGSGYYGDKTFDNESTPLSGHITLGGTNSSTSGIYDAKKFIGYDVKTTSATFKVYVYNGNSSNQNLLYSYIEDGETSEPSGRKVTKSITSKAASPESFEFTVSGTKNKTVVFYVGSTNVVFYQIEVTESGEALPVGGKRGYSVNLIKGRLTAASGTASLLDGIEYCTSSNYGLINKTAVEITEKGTHYIKFTTSQTTKVTVTVSSSNTYYIATDKNPEAADIVATNTTTSSTNGLPAGTYYIVPNGNKVSVTDLSFAIPDAPGAISFSPAGGTVSAEEEITLTSAGADVIKYKWSSSDIDGEGDWSGAETYAADNKPSTPAVGDINNVLSVWASNEGGNTYGSATYTSVANEAPSKPAISGTPASAVSKGTSVTLTAASATGTPTPTYEWFQCDDALKCNPESKATTAEFSPSTTSAGTYYFYAVATNSVGSATSDVVTLTVNPSTDCKLTQAVYSNSFNAFINESAKTVSVYYLEGETAPTFSSATISDDASIDTSNSAQIVVTAEDGVTSATYTVTREAVTPYNGSDLDFQFDGTETWIKTGGVYQTTTGTGSSIKTYYAWVINKLNDNSDNRISLGKTRIYFFVGAATSITLINDRGSSLSSDRNINVYVNGTLQASPTKMPKKDSTTPSPSITITTGGVPAMVEISSNQSNGDTGWGSIVITKPSSVTKTITSAGWATYCSPYALDLAAATGLTDAYIVTGGAAGVLAKSSVKDGTVPANTGLLLKAPEGTVTIPVVASSSTDVSANKLVGVTASTEIDANAGYVLMNDATNGLGFYQNVKAFTVGANTAYLPVGFTGATPDAAPSLFRIVEEENSATNLENLDSTNNFVKFIENGQLLIKKNGIIYDALGRIVK